MHDMRSDLRTGIIEVDFIGFWHADDLEAYRRDLALHGQRIAATGKQHMLLIDHSRAAIQSQEIVAALGQLATQIDRPSQRIAIFTTGHFTKLQAKRIAALRDDIRIFDDRGSALAWLTESPVARFVVTPASASHRRTA